jgi:prephenate dehydrogenase
LEFSVTIQITVVGLYRIGTSIGLALQKYSEKILLIGFDEDTGQAGRVEKLKVFAAVERALPDAVRDADLVILTVPASSVDEYFHLLANHLKPNAQVIDTSRLHQGMDDLASSVLPVGCQFISATPLLNPKYMEHPDDEPHADLFANGALLICKAPQTAPDMIKVAADLAQLLGTQAYFTDPLEADVLLSEVELLPFLTVAALMNTAASNPGWSESKRVAGETFLASTGLLDRQDSAELALTALRAREMTLRALDRFSSRIAEIRVAVENGDQDELKALLEAATDSREDWRSFKSKFDWSTPDGKPVSGKREAPGGLLFQNLIRRKK